MTSAIARPTSIAAASSSSCRSATSYYATSYYGATYYGATYYGATYCGATYIAARGLLTATVYAFKDSHLTYRVLYTILPLQELFRYLSETRPYETYVVTLPEGGR